MRELFLASSESSETSLVLRADDGEEFSLAVTDDVREALRPLVQSQDHAEDAGDKKDKEASASTASALSSTSLTTGGAGAPKTKEPEPEPVKLHPSEIQNRVRAGASAEELAEELGVPESRVEPFAYPVMLERNRIAEVAKQAHPVREDGPASLTLWEILATAFAARGHSLSEADWDAFRNQGEPWIVRITWKSGLSENEAEWTFKQSMSTPATVEARNSVAADLTDPDFVQPVRSLTSVGRGERYDEAIDGDEPQNVSEITDLTEPTTPPEEEEEFLQNPDPKPAKRRRKAVTPHWEDVLLGVRSNTKRPRD
ncbi:MAG: septation protein SepH [Corynebacterium camporealensis]|uniref:septation protein SepH n=1 Tax=Corynebacterium camporealensis TaxID=161896 RepID=UPI002A912D4B|nr:septation protein SepH [Corynebacterium camporealensis]MDY5840036.1 septation protein SepH [Corynebacterium camporealensis]